MVRNCTNGSLRIRITKLQYSNSGNITLPPQETNWSQISVETAPGVTPWGGVIAGQEAVFEATQGNLSIENLKKKRNACFEVAN